MSQAGCVTAGCSLDFIILFEGWTRWIANLQSQPGQTVYRSTPMYTKVVRNLLCILPQNGTTFPYP